MRLTKTQLTLVSLACLVVSLLLCCVVALIFRDQWLPTAQQLFAAQPAATEKEDQHLHSGEEITSLQLSETARRNIGLETAVVRLQSFERTVTLPAMVVERPGRSQVDVTAPFTGIVTSIRIIEAEAVEPGTPLFEIRLTHEDLVTAQRDFLRSLEELDVIEAEVARLSTLTDVIEGKRLLEKKYAQRIVEAALHAQRQGLLLHGLSEQQADEITKSRRLLQGLTVVAPNYAEGHSEFEHLYHVQKISVKRGQHVSAGDTLGVLADHCELYLEGKAFEQDARRLTQAAKEGWPVTAVLLSDDERRGEPVPLKILYIADEVASDSRALHFYMTLPNALVRDSKQDGHRFIGWSFKPGQRMEVRLPVERWEDRIVLPVEAIVQEGAETFVFEQNGDHFDRVPVHLEYRDRDWAVIANDGALVGSTVATRGAFEMQSDLKNKAGGGIDPHAGHNH